MLNNEARRALISRKPVNEGIITARFISRNTRTTIIPIYASRKGEPETEEDAFYEGLQGTINEIPKCDLLILNGDMNAQISNDRQDLKHVIGPRGSVAEINESGERLLLLSSSNSLCIGGNTLFEHKLIYKNTWKSPNGDCYKEIDYMCLQQMEIGPIKTSESTEELILA